MGNWRWLIGWWIALLSIYLLLVGKAPTAEVAEVCAGSALALISTIALACVRKTGGVQFAGRGSWWRSLLRLPARVIADCYRVLGANCASLVSGPSRGSFTTVGFNPGQEDPHSVTRRAVMIVAISFAPNTFVVRMDCQSHCLLEHQLIPAQEGNPDLDWPL